MPREWGHRARPRSPGVPASRRRPKIAGIQNASAFSENSAGAWPARVRRSNLSLFPRERHQQKMLLWLQRNFCFLSHSRFRWNALRSGFGPFIAFSRDGRTLATASHDKTVRLVTLPPSDIFELIDYARRKLPIGRTELSKSERETTFLLPTSANERPDRVTRMADLTGEGNPPRTLTVHHCGDAREMTHRLINPSAQ